MRITIAAVGKIKEKYLTAGIEEFTKRNEKRLQRYAYLFDRQNWYKHIDSLVERFPSFKLLIRSLDKYLNNSLNNILRSLYSLNKFSIENLILS